MMSHQQAQQSAFTLLEMLISVAVFALMAAMAYGGLSQIIRSSEHIQQSNASLAELQFTLALIEKDILQLSNRKIRDEYGDEQAALIIGQDGIIFSRLGWVNFFDPQRSHIQRLKYSVKEKQLIRQYWTSLDQTIEQKTIQSVLLNRVKNLSIKVIDANKKLHTTWPRSSDTPATASAAKALEITIELEQWGNVKKLIELLDGVE